MKAHDSDIHFVRLHFIDIHSKALVKALLLEIEGISPIKQSFYIVDLVRGSHCV
jgi:hypothetical protein